MHIPVAQRGVLVAAAAVRDAVFGEQDSLAVLDPEVALLVLISETVVRRFVEVAPLRATQRTWTLYGPLLIVTTGSFDCPARPRKPGDSAGIRTVSRWGLGSVPKISLLGGRVGKRQVDDDRKVLLIKGGSLDRGPTNG